MRLGVGWQEVAGSQICEAWGSEPAHIIFIQVSKGRQAKLGNLPLKGSAKDAQTLNVIQTKSSRLNRMTSRTRSLRKAESRKDKVVEGSWRIRWDVSRDFMKVIFLCVMHHSLTMPQTCSCLNKARVHKWWISGCSWNFTPAYTTEAGHNPQLIPGTYSLLNG